MQLDPIKPKFKAPRIHVLRPYCDELLSNFAFNIKLRRYDKELQWQVSMLAPGGDGEGGAGAEGGKGPGAGAYTCPRFSST